MNDDIDNFDEDEGIEFTADLITLLDEDDIEHTFELVDTLEFNGVTYVALLPEDILEDDQELVVMKLIEEDEEDILEVVEDDELDEVGEIFMTRLSDLFEFDDSEDDE